MPCTCKQRRHCVERAGCITDSGLPMILATALEQSLRMSAATTASTGTLVLRISVGILLVLRARPRLPSPSLPAPALLVRLLVDRRTGERVEDEG
jgi:hypothetical protein